MTTSHICPKCTRQIKYSRERDAKRAIKIGGVCKLCRLGKIPSRNCPCCNKEIIYKSLTGFKYAIVNNSKCMSCSFIPLYPSKGHKRTLTSRMKQSVTIKENILVKTHKDVIEWWEKTKIPEWEE